MTKRRSFLGWLGGLLAGGAAKPVVAKAVAGPPASIDDIPQALLADLTTACTRDGAVHVETLLSALGSHAGFGCQMAVRAMVSNGMIPARDAFVVVRTKDGGSYYFGDQLNQPLLEAGMSVWNQVISAARQAGAKTLPSIDDVVDFVAASVGSDAFGSLRVAAAYQPFEKPVDSLKRLWPAAERKMTAMGYNAKFTGWYFAGAAQKVIVNSSHTLDPAIAAQIVLEAAVAMAKIDPKILA